MLLHVLLEVAFVRVLGVADRTKVHSHLGFWKPNTGLNDSQTVNLSACTMLIQQENNQRQFNKLSLVHSVLLSYWQLSTVLVIVIGIRKDEGLSEEGLKTLNSKYCINIYNRYKRAE